MPPTVLPVFAALRSGIAVSARASTAPALVPRPHRIAVTTFPSTQSGTTVKSKVLVFVMSAGAVTPASTPTHAAHTAAMHTTVQCGVTDTGRPIFRRRIVASGPPWVCVGRPEPWMGKFTDSSRPFALQEGHGLKGPVENFVFFPSAMKFRGKIFQ